MFKSARIKLTFWYLLIIMAVSFCFSAFIYRSVSLEFQRRLNAIETRLELRRYGLRPPPGQVEFFIEDLKEARRRVLLVLIYTNGVIFVISAAAGYFLAGKTLAPIEEALEEQKRFVADASHELRTPLTSMKTEVEVALRNKKLDLRGAKELLKSNLDEVDKMNNFSDYLLTLSRYEGGAHDLPMEDVDLAEVARQAIERNAPQTKEKKIKIESQLNEVVVKGNPQSLVELISILVNNAVKYSPEGREVRVSVRGNKKHVSIEVADQGIGIDKKDIPHVFDRFFRADTARSKSKADGYGLGLSIAKSIVELHKGTTGVSSKLGKGSTFTVKLPIT